MKCQPLALPEVLLIEPRVFRDDRGFFFETFQTKTYAEAGITAPFVQDNHSGSHCGVLRGLHFQLQQAQGKLVTVIAGEVFDVTVDIRRSSRNFGKWVGTHLAAADRKQLWVPAGFAHGFYVLSDWAEVTYKVTDYYSPQWERTLLWNDPAVDVAWPLPPGTVPILSPKDARGSLLADTQWFD